jgi:opacity protein-like surface antigen
MERVGRVAALGVLLFAASLNAAAADRGFYFGAIGGRADYEFEKTPLSALFDNVLFPGGLSRQQVPVAIPSVVLDPALGFDFGSAVTFSPVASPLLVTQWQPQDDDRSSAWGIVAGYRIMRYAAVELNYLNLGKLETSRTVLLPTYPSRNPFTPVQFVPAQFKRELETTGPSVSALGILPMRDQWFIYARAGVFFADMKLTASLDGNSNSTTFGSESVLWGAGTQFDFGSHWSVRADFQRFNDVGEHKGAGRADIDLLSLGVILRL